MASIKFHDVYTYSIHDCIAGNDFGLCTRVMIIITNNASVDTVKLPIHSSYIHSNIKTHL